MHCVSAYPCPEEILNLNIIERLKQKYNCKVGYSGHEAGVVPSVVATTYGISSLERHITLDRTAYGSDQAASLEISGFALLIDYVRTAESAMGDGEKKILDEEKKN